MNKTELVAAMAEKAGLSKKGAEAALKAFEDVVAEELKKGEKNPDGRFRYIRRFLREQQEREETRRQVLP